jgi:uncharacterized repeat protein (TIGR03837 family)
MQPMQRDWDIFCRVIDNFGDIGVCWRLARQLAGEHHCVVRLWVDELAALKAFRPEVDPSLLAQRIDGIEVCLWNRDFVAVQPARRVIEAFACALPDNYLAAMAVAKPAPRWFNLEYLTAEAWAEAWHGMQSPHPTLPLSKTFFFPGFSDRSGGLLRERDLLLQRKDWQRRQETKDVLEISLFCYDNAPVGPLLDAIINGPRQVRCFVPPGKPTTAVRRHLGEISARRIGQLELQPIPFLTQDDYDQLLWRCDLNFVRGEDSLVRAQWAGKPFVWQIYPQEDDAHWPKLEAFIGTYCKALASGESSAFSNLMRAWNNGQLLATHWAAYLEQMPQQAAIADKWAENLATQPDLASRLVKSAAEPV